MKRLIKRLIVILAMVLIPAVSWGWDNRQEIYDLENKIDRLQEQINAQDEREYQQALNEEWERRNREFDERYKDQPVWLRERNRRYGFDRPLYPK